MASQAPKVYHLKLNIGASTDASLKSSIDNINNSLLSTGIKANLIATGIRQGFSFARDAISESVETGKAFEKTLDNIHSISKASMFQMEAMRDQSLKLGGSTAFSANQSAEALQFMSQAGWTAEKSLTALNDVVSLAAAGDINLANAAETTTDNINAFKLQAKDAGRLADALATGANKSSTNVMGLAAAFQYVAPIAGNMGYTIEDTTKVLGWLADSGIKGQKAGTGLRTILINLSKAQNDTSKKGTKASKAIKELGVSLYEADGRAKPLAKVIEELRTGFSKFKTDAEKDRLANALVNKTGIPALLSLVNTSQENIDKLNNAFKDTTGAAKEMAEIRMDNLAGDVKKLHGYTESLSIQLYDGMMPYLRESAQILRENLGIAEENIPTISKGLGEMAVDMAKLSKPALEMMNFAVENREILGGLVLGNFGGKALIHGGTLAINATKKISDNLKDFKKNGLLDPISGGFSLSKMGLAVTLIAAAGGALIGYRKHLERLSADKSIKDHFGTLTLSLKEIDDIAKGIVYQGNIEKIHRSFGLFKDVEEINSEIESLHNNIYRTTLKVKANLELTDEDKEALKGNAQDYVEKVQKYFEQNRLSLFEFTYGLNDEKLGEDLRTLFANSLQADAEQARHVGEAWINYINEALKDGIVTTEELFKIEEFEQELYRKTRKMQLAKNGLTADSILSTSLGADLSKDSIKDFNDTMAENLNEVAKETGESLRNAKAALMVSYQDGKISEKEYKETAAMLDTDTKETMLEARMNWIKGLGDEMAKRYSKELGSNSEIMLDAFFKDTLAMTTNGAAGVRDLKDYTTYGLYNKDGFSDGDVAVLRDLLKSSEVIKNYREIKATIDSLEKAGKDTSLLKRDLNVIEDLYGIVTGDRKDSFENYLTKSNLQKMYKEAQTKGFSVSDEVANSIVEGMTGTEFENKLSQGTEESFELFKRLVQKQWSEVFGVDINISPSPYLVSGSGTGARTFNHIISRRNTHDEIMQNADGGIYSRPILTYVAEGKSAEAIIPLDNRPRSRRLLEMANEAMGYGRGGTQIVFNPVVTIQGNADGNDVRRGINKSYEEFEANMSRFLERNARVCL